MKIFITGSAGFIGRYAVQAALARGWEVSGIDIRHESESRRMDVRLLTRIEADVVLHLAAFSSNAGFAAAMADNYANNVMGMWNVLRLAAQCGARVVYASSSAVYGSNRYYLDDRARWLLNSEDDVFDMELCVSHYGKSNLMKEMLAESFRSVGLSTLGLRIFNAYGKGDELKAADRQAPPTWMKAAKDRGGAMVIYGDGEQAKDFIHVSDVVECIMRLIEAKAEGIVNIGTGVATSFNDLAALIHDVQREVAEQISLPVTDVQYKPVPDQASYQYITLADTTRLRSLIGSYEFKGVEEGLKLL